MAKINGLGWTTLDVDNSAGVAKHLKNDITNFAWSMPRGVFDVTGLDKLAFERILGLADFSGTLNGVFNDAADQAHDVFKDVGTTSVNRTLTSVIDSKTVAAEVLLTDYPITRSDSGELTWAVPFVLADGTAPAWS